VNGVIRLVAHSEGRQPAGYVARLRGESRAFFGGEEITCLGDSIAEAAAYRLPAQIGERSSPCRETLLPEGVPQQGFTI